MSKIFEPADQDTMQEMIDKRVFPKRLNCKVTITNKSPWDYGHTLIEFAPIGKSGKPVMSQKYTLLDIWFDSYYQERN